MPKKILCLDFDGVVHSYSSGWKGPRNIPDSPVDGALEFIEMMLTAQWDVCIFSSRGRYWGGRRAMRNWLRHHSGYDLGGPWYASPVSPGLENVRFPLFKPSAYLTIDDRAVTFRGLWPSLEDCVRFTPWNKGPRRCWGMKGSAESQ